MKGKKIIRRMWIAVSVILLVFGSMGLLGLFQTEGLHGIEYTNLWLFINVIILFSILSSYLLILLYLRKRSTTS